MAKIIPIRDLKDTTKISELCHSIDEPIYITKNGYDDMVIMSSKVFDMQTKLPFAYKLSTQEELLVSDNQKKYEAPKLYTINEIRKVLSPIFDSYNVKSAILFGSYARGTATEKSDIDLIVDSGLKGLSFFGLVNDVLESLRVPADVFDIREVEKPSELFDSISKEGIKIYG